MMIRIKFSQLSASIVASILLLNTGLPQVGWGQADQTSNQSTISVGEYSYADQIPHDAVFFVGSHSQQTHQPDFENFNQGFQNLLDSMDDFLEWRLAMLFIEDALQSSDSEEFDFSQLQGERWAFAVYGVGETGLSLPTMLYLSEIDQPQVIEQFISKQFQVLQTLAQSKSLPIAYQAETFQSATIHSLFGPGMIPGLGLSAVVTENRLIISTNQSELKALIQREGALEHNLTDNPLYQSIMAQLPDQHAVTVYNNFTGPIAFAKDLLELVSETDEDQPFIDQEQLPDSVKENEELEKALEEINQQSKQIMMDPEFIKLVTWFKGIFPLIEMVQGTGVAWYYNEQEQETTTAFVKLNTEVLGDDSPFAHFFNHEPVDFEFIDYLPRNTGTYSAMNMIEPSELWQTIKRVIEGTPVSEDFFKIINEVQNDVGINLEDDLLSWIGEEFGWVRPVMDLNSVIPVNKGALMIRVKDTEKTKASLQKIASLLIDQFKLPIVLETETYRGRTITTYTTPIPVVPVIPAWALDDDIMILTSHVALIREMIDSKENIQRGIEAKRSYRELSDLISHPANGVSYQDTAAENQANREALSRVASMSTLTQNLNNNEAMIPVMLLDRAAYLLELLQIYQATAKQTIINDVGISTVKRVIKHDINSVPDPKKMLQYKVSLGLKPFIDPFAQQIVAEGNTALAIKLYEVLTDFYPDETPYLSALASLYAQENQSDKALEVYEQAISVMPDTELLITREKFFADSSAADIINRIQEVAAKTKRIEADKALFGIALNKQIQGQEDIAVQLFEVVIKQHPFSLLTPAAEVELALIQDQSHEAIVQVPSVRNTPIIDGQINDPVWQNAIQIPLHVSASNTDIANSFEASAKIVRGLSDFHIAIEGKYPEGWHADEENIVLSVSPARDYTHIQEYITQVRAEDTLDEMNQIKKNRIFNNYGIADPAQREQVLTANEWPFKRQSHEDNTWTIELSVPLQEITHEVNDVQTTWLFNILHLSTSGEQFVQLTANGQSDSEQPSLFLFATLK